MKNLFITLALALKLLHADPAMNALKQQVAQTIPTIPGWCSQEKASAFIDLILEEKPSVCVDIGTFGGSSLFPIASALKFLGQGTVIAIDPWDKIECIKYFDPIEKQTHIDWWGRLNLDHHYYQFLNLLKQYDLSDYSIVMKTTSEKAAAAIGQIDFLYLDGNHSEVMTTKDVELYLPKVRSGGIICINDTLWPEMQPGVELLLEKCDVVRLLDNGNAIIFRKRS